MTTTHEGSQSSHDDDPSLNWLMLEGAQDAVRPGGQHPIGEPAANPTPAAEVTPDAATDFGRPVLYGAVEAPAPPAPESTKERHGHPIWVKLAAGAAAVGALVAVGLAVAKGSGHHKAGPTGNPATASGTLNPSASETGTTSNTATNKNTPTTKEVVPPVGENTITTKLDLITITRHQLPLNRLTFNGSKQAPATPVFDWLEDPLADPETTTAFVNSELSNWTLFMGTQDENLAEAALENITSDPAMISRMRAERQSWQTAHPNERPWILGDHIAITPQKNGDSTTLSISGLEVQTVKGMVDADNGRRWGPPRTLDNTGHFIPDTSGAKPVGDIQFMLKRWDPNARPDAANAGLQSLAEVTGTRDGTLPLPK